MREKSIHRIFVASVLAKGAHALIEIAGGLALYLLGSDLIARWIRPHEWLVRSFPLSEQHFYAFYLLSHGLIKSVLGIDTLLIGFGLPDDRVHSPNEKFDLDALHAGTRTAAVLYDRLKSLS